MGILFEWRGDGGAGADSVDPGTNDAPRLGGKGLGSGVALVGFHLARPPGSASVFVGRRPQKLIDHEKYASGLSGFVGLEGERPRELR